MGITAVSGPTVSFGTVLTSTAGTGLLGNDLEHNDQRAPDLSDLGYAMMDPRQAYAYNPGAGTNDQILGFLNSQGYVDYVPATRSDSSGAASLVKSSVTNVAAGATYVLSAASTALGTYATTIIAPETGKVSESLIAIDSTAALLSFGSAGTIAMWNPAAGTGRCVSITTSSSGDAGTFSIAGRDRYGYKITETIALSQGTTNSSGITVKTQKAFKYVSAITNSTTTTSTSVYIGFSDTFGFPLLVPYAGFNAEVRLLASIYSSAVLVALSSATMVAGSTVATATSTTPDAYGTYASTTASNGTVRLQMRVIPTAAALATVTSTSVAPLFGITQYSSI
jgi:hypothetical protein